MNKSQQREIAKLYCFYQIGMDDVVARGLSALIRAALRQSQVKLLMHYADAFGVRNHPEFLV